MSDIEEQNLEESKLDTSVNKKKEINIKPKKKVKHPKKISKNKKLVDEDVSRDRLILGCLSAIILVGVFSSIFGIYLLTNAYKVYAKGESIYDSAQSYTETTVDNVDDTVGASSKEDELPIGPYNIDFGGLKDINDDVCAWIKIEDTVVDYPVVKSSDNEDYLHVTYDLQRSSFGSIFMDCSNRIDFSCANTIMYGHNMKNGSMFKTINYYYDDGSYALEHPYVWICTPDYQIKYHIISAHRTKCYSNSYFTEFALGSDEYKEWLEEQVSYSSYKCNDYDIGLPVVTLSTCCKPHSDERMVLVLQPNEYFKAP